MSVQRIVAAVFGFLILGMVLFVIGQERAEQLEEQRKVERILKGLDK